MYEDCFARTETGCIALKKMFCKNGNCPFYKTKKQYKADQKKYPHRDKIANGGGKYGK